MLKKNNGDKKRAADTCNECNQNVTETSPSVHSHERVFAEWKPGDSIRDDFIVEKLLGQGGMGKVYLVKRLHDGQLFAMKTLPANRTGQIRFAQLLLKELRVWIDLPAHPNITSFRFFRSISEKKAIFCEYLDDGSLHDLIGQNKPTSMSDVYDIAIQLAWGIHAAHVNGVVHKDIKPGNVLLASDGAVKITDFGISGVYSKLNVAPDTDNPVLSSSNMTAAFCSPEQEKNQGVTCATDVWSYGLTILTLFIGPPTWLTGSIANDLLDAVNNRKRENKSLDISQGFYPVLKRCFQQDPKDRWESMLHIADAIIDLYVLETGNDYPRPTPEFEIRNPPSALKRHDLTGNIWQAPETFWNDLETQCDLTAPDFPDAEGESDMGLRTRSLLEMEWYETLLETATLKHPRTHSTQLLTAKIMNNIGAILCYISDWNGGLELFCRAETSLERLEPLHQQDSILTLFTSGLYQANTLLLLRRVDQALIVFNKLVNVTDRMDYDYSPEKYMQAHFVVHCNRGIVHYNSRRYLEAIQDFEKAIEHSRRQHRYFGNENAPKSLITSHANAANAYSCSGDDQSALKHYFQAVELFKQNKDQTLFQGIRFNLYTNLGKTLSLMGDHSSGLTWIDKALEIGERYVFDEGHHELRFTLGNTYSFRANLILNLKQYPEAVAAFRLTETFWEKLVIQEDNTEYLINYADSFAGQGLAQYNLENWEDVSLLFDNALHYLNKISDFGDTTKLHGLKIYWQGYRAYGRFKTDHLAPAIAEAKEVRPQLIEELQNESMKLHHGVLNDLLQLLNEILETQ